MKKKYTRRDFMKHSLSAASATLPLLSCTKGFETLSHLSVHDLNQRLGPAGDSSTVANLDLARRSNVLFIAVDDLNDWIEPLGGYPGIKTPHMQSLARRGINFTRSFCSAPACGPSRASALTGVAPTTSLLYDFADFRQNSRLSSAVTLPRLFYNSGYKTMGAGKVFHGQYIYEINGDQGPWQWDALNQDRSAWVEFQDLAPEPRGNAHGRANGIWSYDSADQMDWSSMNVANSALPDWQATEWVAQRLQQKHNQPFFMALGLYRPHLPWYTPKRYYDMYPLNSIQLPPMRADDLNDIPALGQELSEADYDHNRIVSSGKWVEAIQAYCASISFADACIGRALESLATGPNAQNTTIVLWSDNGFHLGEKLGWRKFKMWDRANRVPLIIAPPLYNGGGRSCHRVVSLLDLYPTLSDMCLGTLASGVDGRSLVPLLESPDREWCYGAVSSWQAHPGIVHHSVRTEKFRYIRYADGSEELYDSLGDPNEWINLLAEQNGQKGSYQDIRAVLAALLP